MPNLMPGLVHAVEIFQSTPDQSAEKIIIMTMVYNESVNLPIWINYYRRAAPNAVLLVIDHSSNDGSTDNLQDVTKILLPRGEMEEVNRTFLVNSFQNGLLRYYDVVIYTDCDELLVPNPKYSASLAAHLKQRKYSYASPIGINIIHITDIESPLDFTRPLFAQRQYGQFHSQMCKPLIARVPLKWEPGFHSCDQPVNIDNDLYLFHLRLIDKDTALRRQHLYQQIAWSREAIDANHGAHHRYDDERFVREFFLDPAELLRQQGPCEFAFAAEIKRLREESHQQSGVFHTPDFKGPIVEIPEAFRTAF